MNTHPIPIDTLDSDIAILGKKGGGKTYTAKGIVENLLDMGRRVLVLDPLGVWAGLRTSANGTSDGYPIAIFGGLHADMPLDTAAAEPLAQIIATENLPAIIDISELSKGKQQSFLFAFLHKLRTVNREALTIVLEEADVFAPQNPMGDDSKRLFGEIDWIARRGRFRGFRLISVTQRPARLSKDVLTQCSTLIAHKLPAPQDREAVKAWVDGNGDRDKAKEVFDTLARLDVGEAWVWAPDIDLLKRIKFPKIKTLDTSSTPKAGEKRVEPKTLAQVDISAISKALSSSQEQTSKVTAKQSVPILDERHPAIQKMLKIAQEDGYKSGYADATNDAKRKMLDFAGSFVVDQTSAQPPRTPTQQSAPEQKPIETQSAGEFTEPQRKIIRALSMWKRLGHEAPTRIMVAVVAGYSPKSGGFSNLLGQLKTVSAIEYPQPGQLSLLCEPILLSLNDAWGVMLRNLSGPQRKLFDALLGGPMLKIKLANTTGYSPTSGGFSNLMAQLRSIGLARYPKHGVIELSPWVFEVMQ